MTSTFPERLVVRLSTEINTKPEITSTRTKPSRAAAICSPFPGNSPKRKTRDGSGDNPKVSRFHLELLRFAYTKSVNTKISNFRFSAATPSLRRGRKSSGASPDRLPGAYTLLHFEKAQSSPPGEAE
jgi:hypothetical protein